ncbi:MAG: hypothetical protein K9K66_19405 [Desulfarculaceae bacterium]|nr:hypothetical protein [Desulfarculaceae bacterium]MCF8074374.1 hypothetical protein [Desulfarculaceae bacterium]MCF8103823.1 hypothetical protein [Desulfarculaceae bacterium]MCF8118162.1 hypothetical protein [Desulfarculaceae bacterium]
MPRAFCLCLLAASLLLPLAPAGAEELVLKNTCTGPVTVCILSPCGQGGMRMVQVANGSSTRWQRPACPDPAKAPPDQVRLAVFDKRTDAPGFMSMLIAAKAYVKPPAEVVISRQYCEECDTRYKLKWVPLKAK